MFRKIYITFLFYVVVEGALRKWVWPEGGTLLFLLKDVLLISALTILYLFDQRLAKSLLDYYRPSELLAWGVWLFIVTVALILSGITMTSMAGFRYYIAALPILLLHAAAFRSIDEMERFWGRFVVLSIFICMLGFLQFMSPPDSPINSYAWSSDTGPGGVAMFVSDVGAADVSDRFSYVRITGTFSFISPFSAYLQFVLLLALALIQVAKTDRSRLIYFLAAGMSFANILMTGSRSSVIMSALLALPFLAAMLSKIRHEGRAFLSIVSGLVIIAGLLAVVGDVFIVLSERNEQAGDAAQRMFGAMWTPLATLTGASFFGEGLGATFQGMAELTAGKLSGFAAFDEVAQDRIGIELGLFIYVFFVGLKLYYMWATYGLWRRATTPQIKVWALVSLSYQASLIWQIPVYNSVANIFYFVSLAMFVWLRRLDQTHIATQWRSFAAGARVPVRI
jgi:hypothetical protein